VTSVRTVGTVLDFNSDFWTFLPFPISVDFIDDLNPSARHLLQDLRSTGLLRHTASCFTFEPECTILNFASFRFPTPSLSVTARQVCNNELRPAADLDLGRPSTPRSVRDTTLMSQWP
jgi:hypothetical protein